MNGLDERQRDSSVPKSENMIQYAFDKYNKTRDLKESIKATPNIYKTVQQARNEYETAKAAIKVKNEQTPVVTAQDIKDEMYR